MRHNKPVFPLAAALALTLALVSGILFFADSPVYAADPGFVETGTGSRDVPENTPPGVNIGAPISATDDDEGTREFGNTLTYSLGGDDAASFDIDASTGQLITKAPLNYETKELILGDGDSGRRRGSRKSHHPDPCRSTSWTKVRFRPRRSHPPWCRVRIWTLLTIPKNRPRACTWSGTRLKIWGPPSLVMTCSTRRVSTPNSRTWTRRTLEP